MKMNILQFAQCYFTERISEHLQHRVPEQQLHFGLFNCSRILTASQFSSMVITNVSLLWKKELLVCTYQNVFLTLPCWLLLAFFVHIFFLKRRKKKLSQNVFWLMSFVYASPTKQRQLNSHHEVTSASVYAFHSMWAKINPKREMTERSFQQVRLCMYVHMCMCV